MDPDDLICPICGFPMMYCVCKEWVEDKEEDEEEDAAPPAESDPDKKRE